MAGILFVQAFSCPEKRDVENRGFRCLLSEDLPELL